MAWRSIMSRCERFSGVTMRLRSPNVLSEIVVRDEIRRGLDEHAQQIERELAQLDRAPVARQAALPHVEREVVEAISLSRCYRHWISIILSPAAHCNRNQPIFMKF